MKKSVVHIAQVAARFFFDLQPEITELLIEQAIAKSSKAADEVIPVIADAYNCHKAKVIQLFQREQPTHYRAA